MAGGDMTGMGAGGGIGAPVVMTGPAGIGDVGQVAVCGAGIGGGLMAGHVGCVCAGEVMAAGASGCG
jgi:hypothetical protein